MLWHIKLGLFVAALAAVAFGVHWYNQGIRDTQQKLDQAKYDQALISAQADAKAQTDAWLKKFKEKDDATTAAIQEKDARYRAVAASNSELRDRLAGYASGAAQLATSSCAKGIEALSAVFGQCIDQYTAMGKHAEGHLLDSEDCRAKWPENSK